MVKERGDSVMWDTSRSIVVLEMVEDGRHPLKIVMIVSISPHGVELLPRLRGND